MIGNVTYDETWVVSSIKKLDGCSDAHFVSFLSYYYCNTEHLV